MRKMTTPKPTDAELAILRVLWRRGPSSVRDVHEALAGEQSTGYTTVLKLLQIMHAKGIVRRDDSSRAHIYEAVPSEESALKRLVLDLADKAFSGSALRLAMQALSSQKATREELTEIRALLDELERKES
jgi:predicted transcriptional regulator